MDKTSGSPRVTLRLHQLKNRGSESDNKKERGGAKSTVADAESHDSSSANMEGANKSSTPPREEAQLKESSGGNGTGNGAASTGSVSNAAGGGSSGGNGTNPEGESVGVEASREPSSAADADTPAAPDSGDQQPSESGKRHANPDEDEESRRKRRKEDIPTTRGKSGGSTSGGSPKSTGGMESEGEEGTKSVESPGPKVPPLKIVIPSMETEQGSRNGKSTTRHHQALPYVVARSEPPAGEPVTSSNSSSSVSGNSSNSNNNSSSNNNNNNNNSASGNINNSNNNINSTSTNNSNNNNFNNANSNGNNNNNTSSVNNNNNNNNNNNSNNNNNGNGGANGNQQIQQQPPQQPQQQQSQQATVPPPPTSVSPPALSSSQQPTSDPDNGTSLSADEQRSHQRVLRSSHRSGGSSSGAPSGSSSPVAPDNPSPQNVSPPPSEPSSVPLEQKPHGSPIDEKPSLDSLDPPPAPVDLHPRKRKLKPRDSNQTSESSDSAPSSTQIHPHDQPITNCYQLFLNIRKQIDRRRKGLFPVQPKPPQGFKDYLMNRCTYVLAGNAGSRMTIPQTTPPASLQHDGMKELFTEQEKERYRLRMQHVIEKEKLVLSVEQEILRVHGRAARALANQSLPFSACTILRDEEVYSAITPEQEEKDRNARSRYNGRLFLSWLQDVDDKWEKIKEAMLLRHHNEAESLHAVQKMDWEWKLKELGICEFKAQPTIEDSHVPMVHVSDDFDLLPA